MVNQSQLVRPRNAVLLLILCGAPFLAALDLLVVNVAFAEIGVSFGGHSIADLSWILNAYAITYAALLIPSGRYADRVGHKRLFLIGLALFTTASAVAAAALGPVRHVNEAGHRRGWWTLTVSRHPRGGR
jgi:MFS family permease